MPADRSQVVEPITLAAALRRGADEVDELARQLEQVEAALIAEMGGRSAVESIAAMTDESYERLPPFARRRVNRARLVAPSTTETEQGRDPNRARACLRYLATEMMESGMEIGELIEEIRMESRDH